MGFQPCRDVASKFSSPSLSLGPRKGAFFSRRMLDRDARVILGVGAAVCPVGPAAEVSLDQHRGLAVDGTPRIFRIESPRRPRLWRRQHCGTDISVVMEKVVRRTSGNALPMMFVLIRTVRISLPLSPATLAPSARDASPGARQSPHLRQ
jgi:hypothetical protein